MTKVTNVSRALQGVRTDRGLVWLQPGETRDVQLTEAGAKQARRPRMKNVLAFDGGKAAAKAEEQANEEGGQTPAYEAKHRGAGSYSVMDADGKEVLQGLSKEEAEAFNNLSAEDKHARVQSGK